MKYKNQLIALHSRKFHREDADEEVKGGQWFLNGISIARHLENGRIEINWNIGSFKKSVIYSRMKSLAMYFGVPIPLIEDGWVLIRLESPPAIIPAVDVLRIARQLFYIESGANVSEKIFKEIFMVMEYGMSRERWLQKNPKLGLIWDISERVYNLISKNL